SDQNVDAAKRGRAVADKFLQRSLVGHVDIGAEGGHGFGLEVLDCGLHLVCIARTNGDACAFLGENVRSSAPDSFGAAGHDRAQALQSESHVLLLRFTLTAYNLSGSRRPACLWDRP